MVPSTYDDLISTSYFTDQADFICFNFFVADLQMVNIGLRVLARPISTNLPKMYQKLGLDYDERVLPSIMNEVRFSKNSMNFTL